jgi:hypothetical protein
MNHCPSCGIPLPGSMSTEQAVGRAVAGWKLRSQTFEGPDAMTVGSLFDEFLQTRGSGIIVQQVFSIPVSAIYPPSDQTEVLVSTTKTYVAPMLAPKTRVAIGVLYLEIL